MPNRKRPAKRPRMEVDRPNGVNQVEPELPPQPQDPRTTALTNSVILRHLFSFLGPKDLESCYYVCRAWNEVVKPIVFLRYDVEINAGQRVNSTPITITKRARYKLKKMKEYNLTFDDATKNLQDILKTENPKLVLRLIVDFNIDGRDESVRKFLSKFGRLVERMVFSRTQTVDLTLFCEFICTTLPNLKILDYSDLVLTEVSEFNPELPSNKHPKLRKVSFEGMFNVSTTKTVSKFLKIIPNLEEIEKLPIWLINAVKIAEKAKALTSVDYDYCDLEQFSSNGVTVVSAFETLAELKPKLSRFSFPSSATSFEDGITVEMVQPSLLSILQSSADSLRSFEIDTTELHQFKNMPQLKKVQALVFQPPNNRFVKGKFSFRELLPNVDEVGILFYLDKDSAKRYLSKNIESSWGAQIKWLHVFHLNASSLPLLGNMFQNVENFTFWASADELAELLPALAELWSQLKSMTIVVTSRRNGKKKTFLRPGPGRLDCALTGLDPEVVAQLLDPSKRRKFPDTQIDNFKSQSTISKFRGLQQLTLTFNSSPYGGGSQKVYTTLTTVANDFGFKLLPHLNVSVEILKQGRTRDVIRGALEPLAGCNNVEVLDFNPNGEW